MTNYRLAFFDLDGTLFMAILSASSYTALKTKVSLIAPMALARKNF